MSETQCLTDLTQITKQRKTRQLRSYSTGNRGNKREIAIPPQFKSEWSLKDPKMPLWQLIKVNNLIL